MAQYTHPRSYENFQPIANWVTEEANTLEIQLPDFRKEQLKVQLDNLGNLRISGERPIGGNKWSRFSMNFRIPKGCNVSEIHVKHINNVVQVVLPKKITRINVLNHPTLIKEPPTIPKTGNEIKTDKFPEEVAGGFGVEDNEAKNKTTGQEKVSGTSANGTKRGRWSSGSYDVGIGNYVVKFTRPKRVLVNVAVAITLVVVAGFYAVYRFKSSSSQGWGDS